LTSNSKRIGTGKRGDGATSSTLGRYSVLFFIEEGKLTVVPKWGGVGTLEGGCGGGPALIHRQKSS